MCVCDTVCPICLLDFHTRTRLLNHLKYRSKLCATTLLSSEVPLISRENADELDSKERDFHRALYARGQRRHKAKENVFRVPGPLLVNPLAPHNSSHPLGLGRNHFHAPHDV